MTLSYIKPWFECSVGGIRHPQHTQTSSNSSTIAADSSNAVTNIRCCKYSCLRPDDGWRYHPKHVEQFLDKMNCVMLHLFGYILEYSGEYLSIGPWLCENFVPRCMMEIRKLIAFDLNDQQKKQNSCWRLLLGMNFGTPTH